MSKLAKLVLVAAVGLSMLVAAADDDKTCNLWQVCKEHEATTQPGEYPDTYCMNGNDVGFPVFVPGNYAP